MVRGLVVVAVVALANLSGVYAGSIEFTDSFGGSTLDPWWNANVNVTENSPQEPGQGYITYPSTYLGVPCVQLNTVNTGGGNDVKLVHDFSGMTYGDASVWFYDTGAGLVSGNYMGLALQNSVLGTGVGLWTEDYGPQFGISGADYLGGGWDAVTSLDTGVVRTQAWHLLDIDDTAQSLTESIDGNVVYTGPGGTPFDNVYFYLNDWAGRPGFVTYLKDFSFNGHPVSTPEPATLTLLGSALLGLGVVYLRRRRAKA
jgi:hypothetical protein